VLEGLCGIDGRELGKKTYISAAGGQGEGKGVIDEVKNRKLLNGKTEKGL